MDIKNLKYFIAIVDNDYNISEASRNLHISQPALSKFISGFESEENLELFKRRGGRLIGLTPAGENFLVNAAFLVENHDRMFKELREHSKIVKGSVKIGIPPLILTVLFTEIMAKLISLNPTINFEIVELGAFELRKMLLLNELDFGLLLNKTELNSLIYEEISIHKDELTSFMSKDNVLARKKSIDWQDLKGVNLAIFNETFMIHHKLMRKFQSVNVEPNIAIMSGSWDFLLELTRRSDFVTILPSPISKHFTLEDIIKIPFTQPISWEVALVYPIKNHYTQIQEYTKNSIVDYFVNHKDIYPINH